MPLVNHPVEVSTTPETVGDLLTLWRLKADATRNMGFEAVARAYEECSKHLRALHHRQREHPLTVEEASEDSGYSRDHLYRLVQEGTIPNVGENGQVRVRRMDLPRKPRHAGWETSDIYDEPI